MPSRYVCRRYYIRERVVWLEIVEERLKHVFKRYGEACIRRRQFIYRIDSRERGMRSEKKVCVK